MSVPAAAPGVLAPLPEPPSTARECAESAAVTLGRLVVREAMKLEAVSAATPAMVLEPRQLARLVEVFLKFPALPAQESSYTVEVDYSVLSADELEALRRIRDKAGSAALSATLPEISGQASRRTGDRSG